MKQIMRWLNTLIPCTTLFLPSCYEPETPLYLYKITSPELWQQSQKGHMLQLAEMDTAFIHLAREDQLADVIDKFWKRDSASYLILKLETDKLHGELIFESNKPVGNKYYHLYNGNIPLHAVIQVIPMKHNL